MGGSDDGDSEGDSEAEGESQPQDLAQEDSDESDDEGDPSKMVHESLLKGGAAKDTSRAGKVKHVPTEETTEQRDARTLFIGNVAVEVTKSKVRRYHHSFSA